MWLGFDIGGTKVVVVAGDAAGGVAARRRFPTPSSGDPRRDVDAMLEQARSLLAEAAIPADTLRGVGVAAPGPIDPAAGVVIRPPNLAGWSEVPLVAWFGEALGAPVHLENDANAAALAEWRFGAGQGASSLVYLTMSTGVGGGLILDGRLYRGPAGDAGEVGHVPVAWEGELEVCGCGRPGCLEAYTGGRSWSHRLGRVTPPGSRVAELAAGDTPRPEHVLAAAREKDAFALAELERWLDYLARGLTVLSFVLAPEVFVLGTIAAAGGEELVLEPLRARLRERVWPSIARHVKIRAAALGKQGSEYAALCAALESPGA